MYLYRPKTKISHLDQVKPGNILIAQKFRNDQLYSRAVILILEHDETGSTGVILNKSNLISHSLSILTNKELHYGGTYDTHRIGFIHPIENISRAIKISDDVYFSENSEELETIISYDNSKTTKVKAFVGFTVWDAGKLEQEITENKWCINDFKLDELSRVNGDALWGYKLLGCGNIYGLFHNLPDPHLN